MNAVLTLFKRSLKILNAVLNDQVDAMVTKIEAEKAAAEAAAAGGAVASA